MAAKCIMQMSMEEQHFNSKTCLWLCELWFKRLNALYSIHALIESSFSLWRWHMKNPNHINVSYLCLCLTFSQIHSFHSKSTLIVDRIGFDDLLKKLSLEVPHFARLGQFPCLWYVCPSIVVKYSTPKMFHILVFPRANLHASWRTSNKCECNNKHKVISHIPINHCSYVVWSLRTTKYTWFHHLCNTTKLWTSAFLF
jgi:hypothetical protein